MSRALLHASALLASHPSTLYSLLSNWTL